MKNRTDLENIKLFIRVRKVEMRNEYYQVRKFEDVRFNIVFNGRSFNLSPSNKNMLTLNHETETLTI